MSGYLYGSRGCALSVITRGSVNRTGVSGGLCRPVCDASCRCRSRVRLLAHSDSRQLLGREGKWATSRPACCLRWTTRPREIVSMGADLLTQFNELPVGAARAALLGCCSSPLWADRMIAGRPFAGPEDAISLSGEIVSAMTAAELATALAGHPRIGAPPAPERGPDRSAEWSRQEQALVSTAGARTSDELAQASLE